CGNCTTTCSGTTPVCTPSGCAAACSVPTTTCSTNNPPPGKNSSWCVNLATSTVSCGSCDTLPCAATSATTVTCSNGTCAPQCQPGFAACQGVCYAEDDPDHCGTGCSSCPAGPLGTIRRCVAGTCDTATCAPGYVSCSGTCTNLSADDASCSACGKPCTN